MLSLFSAGAEKVGSLTYQISIRPPVLWLWWPEHGAATIHYRRSPGSTRQSAVLIFRISSHEKTRVRTGKHAEKAFLAERLASELICFPNRSKAFQGFAPLSRLDSFAPLLGKPAAI
jgi:hypothetical protein